MDDRLARSGRPAPRAPRARIGRRGSTLAEIEIGEATAADEELVRALARLVPQLSFRPPPSRRDLRAIVEDPATTLLVARDRSRDGRIVGVLTLVRYRVPTGSRGWIEDLVVDAEARGGGVGEALCRAALERCRAAGVASVGLTSNPRREAANRLYRRLGFELRPTNAYVLRLD